MYATSGNFENSGDLILTAVQRVRQIGSFAKIDATVALAKDVLQEQPAVVIFSSFVTVAKTVHKQLSESGWEGELLTGETPAKKRQGMVDNFQVRKMSMLTCWRLVGVDANSLFPLCRRGFLPSLFRPLVLVASD